MFFLRSGARLLRFGLVDLQDRRHSRFRAFILTGIRQGVALALIGVVIGEMFGGSQARVFWLRRADNVSNRHGLRGGILIAVSGMLLTFLTERLERRFSRWRPER